MYHIESSPDNQIGLSWKFVKTISAENNDEAVEKYNHFIKRNIINGLSHIEFRLCLNGKILAQDYL